jgi:hypothetical protein
MPLHSPGLQAQNYQISEELQSFLLKSERKQLFSNPAPEAKLVGFMVHG